MLERILKLSVEHRLLVLLVTVGLAALGVFSLQALPIDAVPDITNNQVQINTEYAALSPVEVEKQITYPVETALAGIPGLEYTRSLSRNGFSQVTAVFEDDVDIYFARQQIAERLGAARESLPPGAEPAMGAITTGLGEVYMWTVEYEHPKGRGATARDGSPGWQADGSYLTPEGSRLETDVELAAYLREVQDWIVRPQLRNVEGVAGVDTIGGYEKQYHVQPDPMKLVSFGLTFHDVIEALERNNASAGAGYVEHGGEAYQVRSDGRIRTVDELREVVVGEWGRVPLRLGDVAKVEVGRELRTGSASENGEEVVVGTAQMLIGANSRSVSAAVDDRIREINAKGALPPDIHLKTVLNRTKLVDATIETVRGNLAEGALFVVVVLLFLLGNVRGALICALAIPLSMLLTATGMVQSRISGNLMSLGAIDFGLIVDGAVIIVENCVRRLAERQHELGRPLTAVERRALVFDAARDVRSATAFGEAIIITVYVPILFLTGVEGKMFKPMALTVIFALGAAFVLSLTFIPALLALAMFGRIREKEVFVIRWLKRAYEPTLRWAVRLRWGVVALAVAAFAASLGLFRTLGQEFVPTLDEKDLALHAMRIPSTSLTQSTEMQLDVERTLSRFPEVAFVFSKTGTAEAAADPMPPNVSDTFVILRPTSEWRSEEELESLAREAESRVVAEADEHGHGGHGGHGESRPASGHKAVLIRLIEAELRGLPGNNYEFTQPIQMRFNELLAGVRGDVAVKVFGDDFETMLPAAERIAAILRSVPGSADVKVEQTQGLPVMRIEVDRAAIAPYGLTVADVQDVVAIAVGGREAGLVFQGDRRFELVVRLPEELRRNPGMLETLPIPLPEEGGGGEVSGEHHGFIPLGTIARIEVSEGVNQVSRENGKRRVVVQANVRGRDIGSFVLEAQAQVDGAVRDGEIEVPSGGWVGWGGQFENLIAARKRLSIVVPICLFLIFLLLFGTFNSVKYALMVFTGVPLALTGGILALWLRGMPFSISAAVGFIALSGVAVLNGLVMITFINHLRQDGRGLEDAIHEGSMTRLRPVLMTALVAALGFVPMAIAKGAGAEVQRPLATVVIGGILSSTFLTLVVLPALYRIWHRSDQRVPTAGEEPHAPAH